MNLEEAEHLIHEMANADASARASKVYRAAAGIVLGALAAERAKREEAERVMRAALDDADAFRVERVRERARSAALMRALVVLSQSPTPTEKEQGK